MSSLIYFYFMAPQEEKKVKKVTRKRVVRKSTPSKEDSGKNILLIKKHDGNFGSIGKSVGTASVIMTALVITIAPASIWILGPVIGAMAIFGIAMGYFASK